jgi:hypothetical protein
LAYWTNFFKYSRTGGCFGSTSVNGSGSVSDRDAAAEFFDLFGIACHYGNPFTFVEVLLVGLKGGWFDSKPLTLFSHHP